MSDDPYTVLGVSRTAGEDEIRRAYRALAKTLHPDLNPGNPDAEEEFKKVAAAFDILGDPEKRKRFDQGEIDAAGHERERTFYRHYAGAGEEHPYHSSAGFEDIGGVFSDLFGFGRRGAAPRMRGADLNYTMNVDFLDAVNGAKTRVTMPDGKTLDVTIPAGLRHGQVLRLKGQGMPGAGDAPPGDAYVSVRVKPHPLFRQEGKNIAIEVPVTLAEAVLGGRIRVPTRTGEVTMAIPAGSNTGSVLRLKGKGIPGPGDADAGDQLVRLKVVLPDKPDAELQALVRDWENKHPYEPRHDLGSRT